MNILQNFIAKKSLFHKYIKWIINSIQETFVEFIAWRKHYFSSCLLWKNTFLNVSAFSYFSQKIILKDDESRRFVFRVVPCQHDALGCSRIWQLVHSWKSGSSRSRHEIVECLLAGCRSDRSGIACPWRWCSEQYLCWPAEYLMDKKARIEFYNYKVKFKWIQMQ